ncbi:hypothetical protein [Lentibacillus sediminis]|uniref:hypothetical protein n=1 Tax=Lentibacillus sediminis TaxID=1940529 RepID=UPI000C1B896F|nr:hypothetical protein [Lentibacillus sediminis]
MLEEESNIYTKLQKYIFTTKFLFGLVILLIWAIFNPSITIIYCLGGLLFILIVAQAIIDFKLHNKFLKANLIETAILIVFMSIIASLLQ